MKSIKKIYFLSAFGLLILASKLQADKATDIAIKAIVSEQAKQIQKNDTMSLLNAMVNIKINILKAIESSTDSTNKYNALKKDLENFNPEALIKHISTLKRILQELPEESRILILAYLTPFQKALIS